MRRAIFSSPKRLYAADSWCQIWEETVCPTRAREKLGWIVLRPFAEFCGASEFWIMWSLGVQSTGEHPISEQSSIRPSIPIKSRLSYRLGNTGCLKKSLTFPILLSIWRLYGQLLRSGKIRTLHRAHIAQFSSPYSSGQCEYMYCTVRTTVNKAKLKKSKTT